MIQTKLSWHLSWCNNMQHFTLLMSAAWNTGTRQREISFPDLHRKLFFSLGRVNVMVFFFLGTEISLLHAPDLNNTKLSISWWWLEYYIWCILQMQNISILSEVFFLMYNSFCWSWNKAEMQTEGAFQKLKVEQM